MVEMPDGSVYHTHLCGRRSRPQGPALPAGPRTALRRCVWKDDGWLYLAKGPDPAVEGRGRRDACRAVPVRRNFRRDPAAHRVPVAAHAYPDRLFKLTGSALQLTGRESLGSWYEQSLVARRQEDPASAPGRGGALRPRHLPAGGRPHALLQPPSCTSLAVTLDEKLGRVLTIMSCNGDYPDSRLTWPSRCRSRCPRKWASRPRSRGEYLQFYYDIGQGLDAHRPRARCQRDLRRRWPW